MPIFKTTPASTINPSLTQDPIANDAYVSAIPEINLNFISDKGTSLAELRHVHSLTKKEALETIKELETHGYINIVKSRTGKIKVFLTNKSNSLSAQDIYTPTMGDK